MFKYLVEKCHIWLKIVKSYLCSGQKDLTLESRQTTFINEGSTKDEVEFAFRVVWKSRRSL